MSIDHTVIPGNISKAFSTDPNSNRPNMSAKNIAMKTFKEPPPVNGSQAPIENALELTALSELGSDVFTNTRPLWLPPGARGIFGGAVIAQCLAAAIKTVPEDFVVHSMHCYFVLAGDASMPVVYYVERVREGRSFATRTVQARQRGKCIFTTTMSFQKPSTGKKSLEHQEPMPEKLKQPEECSDGEKEALEMVKKGSLTESTFKEWMKRRDGDPFERRIIEIHNESSSQPHAKKMRSWVRAKGTIKAPIGSAPHIEALAYVSDAWLIGTVTRAHKSRDVGMVVSLDHSIYFHAPFRVDDWLLVESDSPWAGDQRGFVSQRILDRKGNLIATCYQEGVIRLKDVEMDYATENLSSDKNGNGNGNGNGSAKQSKL